jgi:hypothetical protein
MADELHDILDIEQRIDILARRLRLREMQLAAYGSVDAPPHIVIDKQEAERALSLARAELFRLRPSTPSERPLYLGLLTFQEQDAGRFFGREMLVAELIERVRRSPFLAVLGPSGSGKSSVVRAGLIPMLKGGALTGSEGWHYITIKPGGRPLDALAAALAKLLGSDLAGALALSHQLGETDRALLVAADMLIERAPGQRLVVVVDQAEELWSLAPTDPTQQIGFDAQRCRFIDLLITAAAAPDAPVVVALTMRADFLHRVAEHPELARAVGDHDVIVGAMTQDELGRAIVRPAEEAGRVLRLSNAGADLNCVAEDAQLS